MKAKEIDESKDTGEELRKFQKDLYKIRKKLDEEFWTDIPCGYYQMLEMQDENFNRDKLLEHHTRFFNKDGIVILKNYLTQKYPVNEDYIRQLSDPQLL